MEKARFEPGFCVLVGRGREVGVEDGEACALRVWWSERAGREGGRELGGRVGGTAGVFVSFSFDLELELIN